MGRILIRKEDGLIFSYDPNLAKDSRFRVVEDPKFETAKVKDVINIEERLHPERVPDTEAPQNAPSIDVSEYLEKAAIILDALGITESPETLDDALDLAINHLLNPVPVADLAEIPELPGEAEDVPEADDEEGVDAPAPEEDDVQAQEVDEELFGYENLRAKAELEAWARENLDYELDRRHTVAKLKEEIAAEIQRRQQV